MLGRQSLAELAAEAAEAATAGGYDGYGAPAAGTISKSLLALAVLSSGVPIIPQDTVADAPTAKFVGVLMRLRQRLTPLLLPPRFDSPRDIRWHSVYAAAAPVWEAGEEEAGLGWRHGASLACLACFGSLCEPGSCLCAASLPLLEDCSVAPPHCVHVYMHT